MPSHIIRAMLLSLTILIIFLSVGINGSNSREGNNGGIGSNANNNNAAFPVLDVEILSNWRSQPEYSSFLLAQQQVAPQKPLFLVTLMPFGGPNMQTLMAKQILSSTRDGKDVFRFQLEHAAEWWAKRREAEGNQHNFILSIKLTNLQVIQRRVVLLLFGTHQKIAVSILPEGITERPRGVRLFGQNIFPGKVGEEKAGSSNARPVAADDDASFVLRQRELCQDADRYNEEALKALQSKSEETANDDAIRKFELQQEYWEKRWRAYYVDRLLHDITFKRMEQKILVHKSINALKYSVPIMLDASKNLEKISKDLKTNHIGYLFCNVISNAKMALQNIPLAHQWQLNTNGSRKRKHSKISNLIPDNNNNENNICAPGQHGGWQPSDHLTIQNDSQSIHKECIQASEMFNKENDAGDGPSDFDAALAVADKMTRQRRPHQFFQGYEPVINVNQLAKTMIVAGPSSSKPPFIRMSSNVIQAPGPRFATYGHLEGGKMINFADPVFKPANEKKQQNAKGKGPQSGRRSKQRGSNEPDAKKLRRMEKERIQRLATTIHQNIIENSNNTPMEAGGQFQKNDNYAEQGNSNNKSSGSIPPHPEDLTSNADGENVQMLQKQHGSEVPSSSFVSSSASNSDMLEDGFVA